MSERLCLRGCIEYLALSDVTVTLQVVNGPDHAGAVGPPPSHIVPGRLAVPDSVPPAGWRNVLQEKGPAGFAKVGGSRQGLPQAAVYIAGLLKVPCQMR